jgi:hypothetical protein
MKKRNNKVTQNNLRNSLIKNPMKIKENHMKTLQNKLLIKAEKLRSLHKLLKDLPKLRHKKNQIVTNRI